jgi:hypothetical protein
MKMKYFVFACCLMAGFALNAQQVRVGRSSINCVGSSTLSNGVLISQTGGQSSSVTVSRTGNLVIRQGFQQSNLLTYKVDETDFDILLSPNPNDGNFNVSVRGFEAGENLTYKIYDVNGKIVKESDVEAPTIFVVSVPELVTGIYFIQMESTKGKKSTIKISIL